ncbi:MAG TPA: SCO1664 family protein [Actinomycetota bacterium]|nr:SCO1664 family protein [Actinomycetota bacterium]
MSRDERALEAGLTDPAISGALGTGELEILGLLPNASNHTFLARARGDAEEIFVVYKPRRGETPLWDFPEGTLCVREVATYVVARTLGWPNVPATVLRDGPFGVGSVQRFVASDPEEHYFTLGDRFPAEFRRVAAFDLVVNNADRKAGHCMLGEDGRIYVVDHGVCFSEEPKLRTVIWDFIGEPIEEDLRADLRRLAGDVRSGPVREELADLLAAPELEALESRARELAASGRFPEPSEDHRPFPWPPI